MKKYLFMSVLVLPGCVSTMYESQPYKPPPNVSQQTCQHIITWLERMECFEKALLVDKRAGETTYYREVMAYIRVLIESVRSKKMTEAEAKYAYEQKLSEIKQRLNQRKTSQNLSHPTNQTQHPQTFQPETTHQGSIKTECRPAQGLDGGFDCTTGSDHHEGIDTRSLRSGANPFADAFDKRTRQLER